MLSETNCAKLQLVLNTLACTVTGHKRNDHITPVLAVLHQLLYRFKSKVTFNIASLTYGIRKSGQPAYLWTLILEYKPTRDLQSSSHDLIAVKASKKAKGTRVLSCITASIWNSVPLTFRQCDSV